MRLISAGTLKQFIKLAGIVAALSISPASYAENSQANNNPANIGIADAEAQSAYLLPVGFRHRYHHRFKKHGHKLRSRHLFSGKKIYKKLHGSHRRYNHHKGLKQKRYRQHGVVTIRHYRF